MRNVFQAILFLLFSQMATAQTLFSFGKNNVSRAEFINNFQKNNNGQIKDLKAALTENLDLFIKYKLKVQAGYDMHYDTLANQREDLFAFRKQIESKYLTEEKAMAVLTDEAFQRMQKDLRLSHIIVLFKKDSKETEADALKKITEAYEKLKAGQPFDNVAKMYSEDPGVSSNGGDIGYITAFSLPYEMETVAYTTPKGKYSAPFKTKNGYHIFYIAGERKAIGTMKAAQILIPFLQGAGDDQKLQAAKKAGELYDRLQKDENFENLARAFSGDMQSASSGGVLAEFGVGKYDPVFENTVIALKDNQYSKPFETSFGWHIVKRISNTPVKTVKDAETLEQVKSLVNRDARKQKAQDAFNENILKICNYKAAPVNMENLMALTQKIINGDTGLSTKLINEKTTLHSFNKQIITVGNFWQFTKDAKNAGSFPGATPETYLKEYVKATVFEYYKNNLETFNSDFKQQMKEFKDGNLLFEAMERNIWNKSSLDTEGLQNFYNANSKKYIWEKSADAIIFSTIDKKTADNLRNKITATPTQWRDILLTMENTAQADSGRYELANIPIAERTAFQEGLVTEPFSPNNDGNMVFTRMIKIYEAGGTKSFNDAKGMVINDYQLKLEDEWIRNLKKKYPVKMNEAVWKDILLKGR
jgi:peptidyl-prolyl cis-trans isomerase SurA